MSYHVRPDGDGAEHKCNICLCQMVAFDDHVPAWLCAPCCGEVWHMACLARYVDEATRDTASFRCPQCRAEHRFDAIDEWDASEVLERLFPSDDEYDPSNDDVESSSSSSGESDYQSDSVSGMSCDDEGDE